jgi:hypothetical protein
MQPLVEHLASLAPCMPKAGRGVKRLVGDEGVGLSSIMHKNLSFGAKKQALINIF